MKVFVTGGAGVIGSELVPKLLSAGHEVAVGDLKPRPRSWPQGVEYLQMDLNDLTRTQFQEIGAECVVHLAATFERSIESPAFIYENYHHNIRLSHHLLSLIAGDNFVERLVFASSYLVYDEDLYQFDSPRTESVALAEDSPIRPRNLVGLAKYFHERELDFFAASRGNDLSVLSVRIFRGYGRGSRDVISRWIRSLIQGKPITLYRPEGQFDYIFSADSAEGLIRFAENESIRGVVNLGTGASSRVGDVVEILTHHFPRGKIHFDQNKASDLLYEASRANTERLQCEVDWVPQTTLETGIAEIIRFEREILGIDNR